jgi:hypothetical protein
MSGYCFPSHDHQMPLWAPRRPIQPGGLETELESVQTAPPPKPGISPFHNGSDGGERGLHPMRRDSITQRSLLAESCLLEDGLRLFGIIGELSPKVNRRRSESVRFPTGHTATAVNDLQKTTPPPFNEASEYLACANSDHTRFVPIICCDESPGASRPPLTKGGRGDFCRHGTGRYPIVIGFDLANG